MKAVVSIWIVLAMLSMHPPCQAQSPVAGIRTSRPGRVLPAAVNRVKRILGLSGNDRLRGSVVLWIPGNFCVNCQVLSINAAIATLKRSLPNDTITIVFDGGMSPEGDSFADRIHSDRFIYDSSGVFKACVEHLSSLTMVIFDDPEGSYALFDSVQKHPVTPGDLRTSIAGTGTPSTTKNAQHGTNAFSSIGDAVASSDNRSILIFDRLKGTMGSFDVTGDTIRAAWPLPDTLRFRYRTDAHDRYWAEIISMGFEPARIVDLKSVAGDTVTAIVELLGGYQIRREFRPVNGSDSSDVVKWRKAYGFATMNAGHLVNYREIDVEALHGTPLRAPQPFSGGFLVDVFASGYDDRHKCDTCTLFAKCDSLMESVDLFGRFSDLSSIFNCGTFDPRFVGYLCTTGAVAWYVNPHNKMAATLSGSKRHPEIRPLQLEGILDIGALWPQDPSTPTTGPTAMDMAVVDGGPALALLNKNADSTVSLSVMRFDPNGHLRHNDALGKAGQYIDARFVRGWRRGYALFARLRSGTWELLRGG